MKKMSKKVLTWGRICDIMYKSPRESGGVESEESEKVFKKTWQKIKAYDIIDKHFSETKRKEPWKLNNVRKRTKRPLDSKFVQ